MDGISTPFENALWGRVDTPRSSLQVCNYSYRAAQPSPRSALEHSHHLRKNPRAHQPMLPVYPQILQPFLPLWSCLFWTFHTDRVIQHVAWRVQGCGMYRFLFTAEQCLFRSSPAPSKHVCCFRRTRLACHCFHLFLTMLFLVMPL